MQKVLSKRILRDLKDNFFRYFALFFLIVIGMFMIISIVGAAETTIRGVAQSDEEAKLEDGEFSVFVPFSKQELAQLTDTGITVCENFSMDFLFDNSTLRVYKERTVTNLFVLSEGDFLSAQGDILLEQHYAQSHNVHVGDKLGIGGMTFTVAGLGSTPDYNAALESMSDSSVDSELFGTAFVSKADYEQLVRLGQSVKTEEYGYSYLLNGSLDDDKLKEIIQSFELDRSQVQDPFFQEMLADAERTKTDIQEGIAELLDGSRELSDGLSEIAGNSAMQNSILQEAADGSIELTDGVKELQVEANEMLEEYFTYDLDNLIAFIPQEDNPRIKASANDVMINKYVGMAAGVILMILFTYVISVFVVHSIERESSVIGALYAVGATKTQLLVHYLLTPVCITLLGGIVGSLLGFSQFGIGTQMQESVAYYSLPHLSIVYPGYLLLYGLAMPPFAAILVNLLVISRKLDRTALSLMRGEQQSHKISKIRTVNLGRMGFLSRFRIRQQLRELRSGMALVGAMFICLLVLMLAVNCYVFCDKYSISAVEETKYEYLYTYKYPTEEIPLGGTEGYMESLKKSSFGYALDVNIIGLTKDNPYFDVEASTKKNEIVISSAVASKFSVKVGEKFVVSDEVNEMDYAFTVTKIVPFSSSLYAFMDIDIMRELFQQEDDYYNVVFSDRELEIESGRLYGVVTKANIEQAANVFITIMWPMFYTMSTLATLIFLIVMYLMMKVMIDRASFSISLMKVFGYRKWEIKKLYLDGNFMVVAIGSLIGVPLAKRIMDAIYPYFVSNTAMGLNFEFTWQIYGLIYLGIFLCYLFINTLLVHRLNRVLPAEVLKNRE